MKIELNVPDNLSEITLKQYQKYNTIATTNEDATFITQKMIEIFLPWHIEHIGHKNPAVGATWNMEKFTCDHGVGNTLFVNIVESCVIYL